MTQNLLHFMITQTLKSDFLFIRNCASESKRVRRRVNNVTMEEPKNILTIKKN